MAHEQVISHQTCNSVSPTTCELFQLIEFLISINKVEMKKATIREWSTSNISD